MFSAGFLRLGLVLGGRSDIDCDEAYFLCSLVNLEEILLLVVGSLDFRFGHRIFLFGEFSEGHESQFHISGVDIIIIESFLVEVIRTDCAGEETLIYHRGELPFHLTLGSDPCALNGSICASVRPLRLGLNIISYACWGVPHAEAPMR